MNPKENGYQSLHTVILLEENSIPIEFQIRTQEMDMYAEYGVAAHWSYKEGKKNEDVDLLISQKLRWIKDIVNLGEENLSSKEYLKLVKLDLYADRIFVMTPKGDPVNLPAGASCIDFAYKIHEEVGNTMKMAKVNGEIVKISHQLKNGDMVEILTDRKQKPKKEWLEFVKTPVAIKSIKSFLKK